MSTTIGPANASRTRPRFPASGSAMGRPSAAVLFFDRAGAVMVNIFVPRDSRNALRAAELAAFHALAKRVCRRAAARPRTIRRPS